MKITIRRILNLLLYLSFCVMFGTGLLMAFRLVPGSRGGRGLEVLGWDRHQWGDLHTWIAYAFAILLAAHLVLAWAWLKKVAAKGHLWRLVIGLAIGLAIILGFLLMPVTRRERGRGRGQTHEALKDASSGRPLYARVDVDASSAGPWEFRPEVPRRETGRLANSSK